MNWKLLKKKISSYKKYKIEQLKSKQSSDGSWRFPCENSPLTDAYMIITLRVLKEDNEKLIASLVNRLLATQLENGAWKLYADETHI
ncbi:hypothetical protein BKP37_00485 [Anaerobacillus alkalilacustris]|uniref:Squalene cyclase N-terminal domain-containing protein n=1 Tax=Anaerobacillus alkalilacustris TaxID=393763 RepID=A0A1S2LWY0_9BACI|nr:hypothetical protein [Anaerobacillus alkalilacustris]OIJ17051.1 hypothetical protein BKP37_00485 [Anaerobacillus alkalilacustris]